MDIIEISNWANYLTKWIYLAPILIGCWLFSGHTPVQRSVFWLVVISLLTELISARYFVELVWQHVFGSFTNLPLLHIYTVIQFGLLLCCYKEFLQSKLSQKKFWLIAGGFAGFAIINAVWIDGIFYLNPSARLLQSLILIPVAIFYLINVLRKPKMTKLEKDPLFWVSAAMIIYFSGSIFIFIVSNYLLDQRNVLLSIYLIHTFLNTLALIFYTIALWIKPQHLLTSR